MKIKGTRFQVLLELAGAMVLVGMIAYIIIQWNTIPEIIPGHYNGLGQVDRWTNKNELIILPIVAFILYISLTVTTFFPFIWNVPYKITENNKEAVYQCIRTMMILIKIEMISVFFYIIICSSQALTLSILFLPIFLLIIFGTLILFMIVSYKISKR